MSPLPPDSGLSGPAPIANVGSPKKFTKATIDTVYTQKDVDQAGKEGLKLLIFEGKVYNVTMWYKHHPGGELTISHLFGKDATAYVTAFHPKKVLTEMMPRFCVGTFKAAPKSAKDALIEEKFTALVKKVDDDGYHNHEPKYFNQLLMRYTIQFSLSILSCLYLPNYWNAVIGGIFMASVWQQVAFYCHDSGHNGVTGDRKFDYNVGVLLASVLGGLSMGWWKDSHNIHHIITNHPEHDPDIQHMPVMAIDERYLTEKPVWSTYHNRFISFDWLSKTIVPYQHYCFFLINAFGRFLLYGLSWTFVIKGHKQEAKDWRLYEMAGMGLFFAWYVSLCRTFADSSVAMIFVLVSHLAASILHLQINVSHYGMSTEMVDCNEHFATKALRTTMDVSTPAWFDWFHGGLQFQVIHHLFPRVPRHNLRKLKPLVLQFCEETGLEYIEHGFIKGNAIVIDSLRVVSQHCWFLLSTAGEKIHI